MTKVRELDRAIMRALAIALASTALAAPVYAQSSNEDDETRLETITVTGSRIKRTDIETSQPVFVLEREDLARTGLASVGDILQDPLLHRVSLTGVAVDAPSLRLRHGEHGVVRAPGLREQSVAGHPRFQQICARRIGTDPSRGPFGRSVRANP